MNTPQLVVTNPLADPENRQYVYAQELSDCLEPKRGNGIGELNAERWDTIQEIIKARDMQERYEAGQTGRFEATSDTVLKTDSARS